MQHHHIYIFSFITFFEKIINGRVEKLYKIKNLVEFLPCDVVITLQSYPQSCNYSGYTTGLPTKL